MGVMATVSALLQKQYDSLFKSAKKAQAQAYAPYSKFKVGAALKIKGKSNFITGCNIENASFGATVCAERVAILKAISDGVNPKKIEALCLVTSSKNGDMPCGMCLQVMAEFLPAKTPIVIANESKILFVKPWEEYLPYAFSLKTKS